ncbi:MAG: hypothetical protein EBY65_11035 [Acidimicrobiia bacterium]|nr:hypothetical protein [Acidimicrobiia bacterium]
MVSLLAAACSADTAGGASVAATPDHEHEEANAIVERVVDGDTIVVDIIGNHSTNPTAFTANSSKKLRTMPSGPVPGCGACAVALMYPSVNVPP